MVAYTDTLGFNKGSAAYPSTYTNRFTVIEIDLDFAKIAAARTAAGVAALGSADTLVLCTLPKGTFVLNVLKFQDNLFQSIFGTKVPYKGVA